MTTLDRPMNEYEGALFGVLMILARAVAKGETSKDALAAQFREHAELETRLDSKNGAAIFEMLARNVEVDRYYTVKPPFGIIDGGKKD